MSVAWLVFFLVWGGGCADSGGMRDTYIQQPGVFWAYSAGLCTFAFMGRAPLGQALGFSARGGVWETVGFELSNECHEVNRGGCEEEMGEGGGGGGRGEGVHIMRVVVYRFVN